ncbi:MAG: hypothetical protein BWY76_02682 [bacterium ADurb.Bin429]|nr:MAG: hypothetical protein BWY76_02682 [bacterium ADurb.Bin429]
MPKRNSRKEHQERMARLRAEAQAVVATGVCPQCGQPLKRNLAMAGWWQCVCYATPSFRDAQYRDLPSCSFQCFTE